MTKLETETETETEIASIGEKPKASYAMDWRKSRGSYFEEPAADDRTPFQRDRDRILFSEAFRRLQYKRQVFMNTEEGDFRTRLTHTLEVAQLARAVCRNLSLDEDLGEVCGLAHDIGHPPFGHAGEDALNDCMTLYGGFNHNIHTIRILRKLENSYASFNGLNLTWETIEGISKHNGPIPKKLAKMQEFADLDPKTQTHLEGQVAAECDAMAYLHHDLDDGISTGRLTVESAFVVDSFRRAWDEVNALYPRAESSRLISEAIRRMLSRQIHDLEMTTLSNITRNNIEKMADVRKHKKMLVTFSARVEKENKQLKDFLMKNLYRHTSVNRFNFQAHRMVRDLFKAFMNHRKMLPPVWRDKLPTNTSDEAGKARVVCDYIANLTDRTAMREHQRLFAPLVWE